MEPYHTGLETLLEYVLNSIRSNILHVKIEKVVRWLKVMFVLRGDEGGVGGTVLFPSAGKHVLGCV